MKKTSNKISLITHYLLEYLCVVKKKTRREMVGEAVTFYKTIYSTEDLLSKAPCQHPLIYPQPNKFVLLNEDDRAYLNTLPTHHPKRMPEALDRVLITYQNEAQDIRVPEHLRVNWLDRKYLNWIESCP